MGDVLLLFDRVSWRLRLPNQCSVRVIGQLKQDGWRLRIGLLNQKSSVMEHGSRRSPSQLVFKWMHLLKASTCIIAEIWTSRINLYYWLDCTVVLLYYNRHSVPIRLKTTVTTCLIHVSTLRISTSRVQSRAVAIARRCNRWRHFTPQYDAQ